MAISVRKHLPVDFFDDTAEELARARVLFPLQEEKLTSHEWLSIVTEELGEVANELNDRLVAPGENHDASVNRTYTELVQTAAMCARMALSIKNREQDA